MEQKTEQWITSSTYSQQRRKLIEDGVSNEAPEFLALRQRIVERDDCLYEQHGRSLEREHAGKWIAIATDGQVLFADTPGELIWKAESEFPHGEFAIRRVGKPRGLRFHS